MSSNPVTPNSEIGQTSSALLFALFVRVATVFLRGCLLGLAIAAVVVVLDHVWALARL